MRKGLLLLALGIYGGLTGCSALDAKTEPDVSKGWESVGVFELAQITFTESKYQPAHDTQGVAKEADLPKQADSEVMLWIRHGQDGQMKIYKVGGGK
ncbi:hypothetical protein D6779_04785 [Candidatus Parcubacteria bacterium]|nr:MAG: hypothetical protein D6779_04785 [Candidatus Parcubacteria bacterium]